MYYIYVLMDSSKPGEYIYGDYKFDFEPFYIGKGTGNRIKNTFYDKSIFKKNKIEKLKKDGIKIISKKIIIDLSNEKSLLLEKKLISLIGRRDLNKGTLVNTTDGGNGRLNSKHSEEIKNKISENRKGKGIGWKHTEETLEKMSINQIGINNGFYGKTHNIDVRKKQSDRISGLNHPMYNKKHDGETIKKLKEHRKTISNEKIKEICQKFNKEVLMYDLKMNYLNEFESVKEASLYTNINESIISKCCRGDIKSPTRYFFKYKNKINNIKMNKFLINENDTFEISYKKYELLKRNTTTAICKIIESKYSPDDVDKLETLKYEDNRFLTFKEVNDSDIMELYSFIKNIDNSFKLIDDIIFNDKLSIKFLRLIKNCELFKDRKYLIEDNEHDVYIFEDEWREKKEVCKSRIKYMLGKSNIIYGRKCEIKELNNSKDNKLIKEFLNKNHIQGNLGSKIKIGLFYNDELVSLMTFGALRRNMGYVATEGSYEMLRFCNKLNTSVAGGASKLFKYFLKHYNPEVVISYSENRWGNGNLYLNLGFDFLDKTIPNYFWIFGVEENIPERQYRYRWRKDILIKKGYDPEMTEVQIMNYKLNSYRIFDKGSTKFIYKRKES